MKQYLEALEIVTDELDTPEFIRADITDKTDIEVGEIKSAIIDVMKGKNYTLKRHLCGHDEGKSCKFEVEI